MTIQTDVQMICLSGCGCLASAACLRLQLTIRFPDTRETKISTSKKTLCFCEPTTLILFCFLVPVPLCVYIPICLQSDTPHTGKDLLKAAHFVKCDSCITGGVLSGSHTYSTVAGVNYGCCRRSLCSPLKFSCKHPTEEI